VENSFSPSFASTQIISEQARCYRRGKQSVNDLGDYGFATAALRLRYGFQSKRRELNPVWTGRLARFVNKVGRWYKVS
jgi:hypothetical protein